MLTSGSHMGYRIIAVVALALTADVAPAAAQQPDRTPSARPLTPRPTLDVGVSIGAWNLNGDDGMWSVRVSQYHRSWLAAEVSIDSGHSGAVRYGMITGAVRFEPPAAPNSLQPFVTLGGGVAHHLSFRLSPVVGAGIRTAWQGGRLATRVEIQKLPNGHGLRDSGRLLVGLVVVVR